MPGQLLGNPNCGWIRGIWREDGHVRKVLVPGKPDAPAHWAASTDPQAWSYWRREELVYTSGLPARLGLDAPALLGVERHGEEVHLLLEDVEGRTGADLRFDEIVEAARILGRSQGTVVAKTANSPIRPIGRASPRALAEQRIPARLPGEQAGQLATSGRR